MNRLFIKKYCSPLVFFEYSGLKINPFKRSISVSSLIGTSFSFVLFPKSSIIRLLKVELFKLYISFPSLKKMKFTSGWDKDILKNSFIICLFSTLLDFRNFRLAGILKNKFFTKILVPFSATIDLFETS